MLICPFCFKIKYTLSGQDRHTHFGLIPRSINYLFNQLRQRTQETESVFYIRVSYYEIYNEQVGLNLFFFEIIIIIYLLVF